MQGESEKNMKNTIQKEQVRKYLAFGRQGDYVENKDNGRRITRTTGHIDRLPNCNLYQNEVFVREEKYFSKSIDFLFGE